VRRKRLERSVATALVALGFKKREAEQAAVAAVGRFPDEREAGALVRESLRLFAP
jgi:Holliday junction resolvasome RuvABC DNA-binding subunit